MKEIFPKINPIMTGLYALSVVMGFFVIWIPDYPAMIDASQHVAQVSSIKKMIIGDADANGIFHFNWNVPYLLSYVAMLPFYLFGAAESIKIIVTIIFLIYLDSAKKLRNISGADERLAILVVPAFFGFTYKWGFIPFMLAVPLGMYFFMLGYNYSRRPSLKYEFYIIIFGIFLLYCHGLVYAFSMAAGVFFILSGSQPFVSKIKFMRPYIFCFFVLILHLASNSFFSADAGINHDGHEVVWGYDLSRILGFFIYPWGTSSDAPNALLIGVLFLFAPKLIGCNFIFGRFIAVIFPLFFMIWFFVPHFGIDTYFLYERFSIFFAPIYLCLWSFPERMGNYFNVGAYVLHAAVIFLMAEKINDMLNFKVEIDGYKSFIEDIPRGKRILGLIHDRNSAAAKNTELYTNFHSWYQAEGYGISEVSFSGLTFIPVAYKDPGYTSIRPGDFPANSFSWRDGHGERYDYFLVRGGERDYRIKDMPDDISLRLISSKGAWRLYESSK